MPPVLADVEELWIGLNDLKLQMNFEWSDGTPVRFTYWHPFEPNNFRDSLEDCVTIWGPVRARGRGQILHPRSIPIGMGMGHPGETGLNLARPSCWEGKDPAQPWGLPQGREICGAWIELGNSPGCQLGSILLFSTLSRKGGGTTAPATRPCPLSAKSPAG